jgi:hypothetical protein
VNARRRACTEQTIRGRMRKAAQFLEAAEILGDAAEDQEEIGDSLVTLCVQAGIAAADAICCRALGEHAQGEDHTRALDLLRRAGNDGPQLASALAVLLGMKVKASYDAMPVSGEQRTRAHRKAKQLVDAARQRVGA